MPRAPPVISATLSASAIDAPTCPSSIDASARRLSSVQLAAQRVQRLPGLGILRREARGGLELAERLPPLPLLEVDPAEVEEREVAGLVAARPLGLLEPG